MDVNKPDRRNILLHPLLFRYLDHLQRRVSEGHIPSLERAVHDHHDEGAVVGNLHTVDVINVNFNSNAIRSDPRFKILLRKMGLPEA